MKSMTHISAMALVVFAVQGCNCGLLKKDVSVKLDPDPVITITTHGDANTGVTDNPIQVSPTSAGKDYTDNKDKIDKAVLESIEFEVTQVYPDNAASKLLNATVTLTNQNPNATHKSIDLVLGAPVNIALGASNTFTAFTPDPSDFLLEIVKNGDTFTVAATSEVDQAPVHIDLKIHLKVTLTISLL